jgi:predicted extracellular nuclease
VLLSGCSLLSLLDPEQDPTNDGPLLTTINDIRNGNVDIESEITIEDAVITSLVGNGVRYFFVQDMLNSENAGILVFKNSADSLSLAVGDKVTVTGVYKEYNGQSEIVIDSVDCITQTGTSALPEVQDISSCDVNEYEQFEGMLVEMCSVEVTSVDSSNKVFELNSKILVDDMMYSPTPLPTVGTQINQIVGILHYAYGAYRIEPRKAADIII